MTCETVEFISTEILSEMGWAQNRERWKEHKHKLQPNYLRSTWNHFWKKGVEAETVTWIAAMLMLLRRWRRLRVPSSRPNRSTHEKSRDAVVEVNGTLRTLLSQVPPVDSRLDSAQKKTPLSYIYNIFTLQRGLAVRGHLYRKHTLETRVTKNRAKGGVHKPM